MTYVEHTYCFLVRRIKLTSIFSFFFLNLDEKSDTAVNLQKHHRSSRSPMFFKIGILKNFAILTGKHQCCSLRPSHLLWLLLVPIFQNLHLENAIYCALKLSFIALDIHWLMSDTGDSIRIREHMQ